MLPKVVLVACLSASVTQIACGEGRPGSIGAPSPRPDPSSPAHEDDAGTLHIDSGVEQPIPSGPPDAGPVSPPLPPLIQWDAATPPTSDHVRGIDAGTPDRDNPLPDAG